MRHFDRIPGHARIVGDLALVRVHGVDRFGQTPLEFADARRIGTAAIEVIAENDQGGGAVLAILAAVDVVVGRATQLQPDIRVEAGFLLLHIGFGRLHVLASEGHCRAALDRRVDRGIDIGRQGVGGDRDLIERVRCLADDLDEVRFRVLQIALRLDQRRFGVRQARLGLADIGDVAAAGLCPLLHLTEARAMHADIVVRELHALAVALGVEIGLDGVEAGEFGAFLDAVGRRLHARGLAFDLALRKEAVEYQLA